MEEKNIDPAKVEAYLATLDKEKRELVKVVLDNLIYFTTEELVNMVERSLDKFIQKNVKYNLLVPKGKIGSEHFLMIRLRHKLNPVQVISTEKAPDNDYPALIIDDAIYSSFNMCANIDDWRWNTKAKNKIFIVVGVLSTPKVQVAVEKYFNAEIIADKILENLTVINLFPNIDYYEIFNLEHHFVIPIFFQHKIANSHGTYPFIKYLVKNPISRQPINSITTEQLNDFINSF